MPRVLSAVVAELGGAQASIWLRGVDGLRRAWSVADDTTTASVVNAQLRNDVDTDDDAFVLARLTAGRRDLGVLSLRPGRELTAEDRIFVVTVADVLAPALRGAEYAHRLESEVAARVREIDEQHRFTETIVDSLPVGLYVIDRAYRIQAWNRKR